MSSLLKDLRTEIEKGSVLVVVGAGVSVASTRGNALASWTGLLKHGVSRCVDVATGLPEGWADRVNAQIDSNDPLEMVSAAENISQRLGYPAGGVYRKWLRDSVGSLEVLDSLHRSRRAQHPRRARRQRRALLHVGRQR